MNPKPIPNVLVTDQASEKFRNQVRHILNRLFKNPNGINRSSDVAESICSDFVFLKGDSPYDSPYYDFVGIIDEGLQKLPPEDLFDFIDIICLKVSEDPYYMCFYDKFEEDINDVLRSNSIGYKLVEGMQVPFTEEVEAEELIVPAFRVPTDINSMQLLITCPILSIILKMETMKRHSHRLSKHSKVSWNPC